MISKYHLLLDFILMFLTIWAFIHFVTLQKSIETNLKKPQKFGAIQITE